MEIKEDLFDNVKPGSRVHYLTPQGQTRSGTVVMNKGTHLVLNRGGGQPQVVTPKNYVKHSEGGKVKGALLSNLAKSMKSEETVNEIHKLAKAYLKKTAPGSDDAEKIDAGLDKAISNPKNKENRDVARKAFNRLQGRENAKDRVGLRGFIRRRAMGEAHNLPRTGTDEIADMEPRVQASYDMDPQLKAKLTKKLLRKRKQIVKEGNGYTVTYGGKTHLSNASIKRAMIQKGIQRKVDAESRKQLNKKQAGTMAAKKSCSCSEGKNFKSLVAELIGEASKKVKTVNWQNIETSHFSVYKHGEGGMPLKHHMAQLAAAGIPSRKAHSPYVGHTALEVPKKHEKKAGRILYGEAFSAGDKVRLKKDWAHGDPDKVYKIYHTNADGQHWVGDKQKRGWYAGDHQLRPARTWKKTYTMEGRESEYRANQQLAGTSPRRKPGHYLVRNGSTLSGPHEPTDAVRKYKGMSDNTGVKIVHVKEATQPENAVDNKGKADKITQRAIALSKAKKLKGKTANVEPELETPTAQMSQPVLQGAEGPPNVRI